MKMRTEKKKGWEIKKLGEVCNLSAGGDVPKEDFSEFQTDEHRIPIYANGEKNNGLYGYTSIAKITRPSITVSARGTIGFSIKRLESFYPIVRLITIIPKDLHSLDLSFLDYAIKSIDFKHSGSSIPQLTVPMIRDYEIPVPPLPEQQRIVSILDEAFAAIALAKANAEQNLKNAKELFESYLQGVFEKKGEGWEEKTLKEITTKIGSGATPRGGNESYKTEGISLVRSMNVHDFEFRPKKLAFIDDQQAKELNNVTLQENDVLLNITGASVARCCVIPKVYLPARVNQHVSIIRAKKEVIDSNFLSLLLTSKFYKDQLLFTGGQGATRQAITKVQLELFKISFPKYLKEQQSIVQKLDALSAETKRLEAIYRQKLLDLEELKKSVLQKAFNGEL
jgi:type I restriction enzyme, S subunit